MAYVRDAARGRVEVMVVNSTAAGWVETAGTTGVLKRMAMDRLEKSIVVVFVILWCWLCMNEVVLWIVQGNKLLK